MRRYATAAPRNEISALRPLWSDMRGVSLRDARNICSKMIASLRNDNIWS